MKTFEGWVASMLSLDEYLGFIPCTIDKSFMQDITWYWGKWFYLRVHYYLFTIGRLVFETQLIFVDLGKFSVFLGEWPTIRIIKKNR